MYNAIKCMLITSEASRCDFEKLIKFNYPKMERKSVTVNYRLYDVPRGF